MTKSRALILIVASIPILTAGIYAIVAGPISIRDRNYDSFGHRDKIYLDATESKVFGSIALVIGGLVMTIGVLGLKPNARVRSQDDEDHYW